MLGGLLTGFITNMKWLCDPLEDEDLFNDALFNDVPEEGLDDVDSVFDDGASTDKVRSLKEKQLIGDIKEVGKKRDDSFS